MLDEVPVRPTATDRALAKAGRDYIQAQWNPAYTGSGGWNYSVSPSTGSFTTSAANVTIT